MCIEIAGLEYRSILNQSRLCLARVTISLLLRKRVARWILVEENWSYDCRSPDTGVYWRYDLIDRESEDSRTNWNYPRIPLHQILKGSRVLGRF